MNERAAVEKRGDVPVSATDSTFTEPATQRGTTAASIGEARDVTTSGLAELLCPGMYPGLKRTVTSSDIDRCVTRPLASDIWGGEYTTWPDRRITEIAQSQY
jgi:hypothetical protein